MFARIKGLWIRNGHTATKPTLAHRRGNDGEINADDEQLGYVASTFGEMALAREWLAVHAGSQMH